MTIDTPRRDLALRFASIITTPLCYLVMLGIIIKAARRPFAQR
jgi:hypothetical protein